MGQSLVKNYMHIVFSTKHRKRVLNESVLNELSAYLGGICNELNCQPIKIGGHENHVHILCMLSKNICLADLLKKLKSNSSRWLKTKEPSLKNFKWQSGYGGFSVDQKGVKILIKYIENQKEHHTKESFKDEYVGLLNEYDIPYNEEHLWDD